MDPGKLIDDWRRGLRVSHKARYEAAKHYEALHRRLSIPTILVSATLGATVLTEMAETPDARVRAILGGLSVAVVALTAPQGWWESRLTDSRMVD